MTEPLVITPETAAQHGLAPISIRIDPSAAGLLGHTFVAEGLYVGLSGPPGGAIVVEVWDASQLPSQVEDVVRARMPSRTLEIQGRDHAQLLGGERGGVVFTTGQGFARIGWFGVLVERADGNVLVVAGVSARGTGPVTAASVLGHPSIARALSTLELR